MCVHDCHHKCIIPLLSGVDSVLRGTHQAALTLQLLQKLDIRPQPLFRPQGVPIEPLTLFQKMGVGQLDLYILNPGQNSQEYQTFMQTWPDAVSSASKSQTLSLSTLASVSALLVWHPACPQERVVRVLFPGVTPQAKLLQGLEKLKGLTFLQKPTVTTGDLERLGEDKNGKRTGNQDSGRSQVPESTPKQGRERGVKDEGKEVIIRDKGKVFNGATTRDADKNRIKEIGVKQKAASSEKYASKKGGGKDGKKEEKTGIKEENSAAKNDQGKKVVSSKSKNENKTKQKKETKNDSKTEAKKTKKKSGKELNNSPKVHVNNESPHHNSRKTDAETVMEIVEPEGFDAEQANQKPEKESEEIPCGSRMSTPEDMTADFLRLQAETTVNGKQKICELENEKSLEGLSEETHNEADDTLQGKGAGNTGIRGEESIDNGETFLARTGEQADVELKKVPEDQHGNAGKKPAKIVGFPSAFNDAPKNERSVQLDLTPTEFTLLDGALKYSPSSQPSPENQAPISPDEETVEPDSPDSRPNSAGHTPYCLSPDDVWCNRATLSRLQAQMDNSESDVKNGSSQQSEGQVCQPRTTQENHTNPREKHLSFLSLGTFKDGSSDPSPSVTTTTTTHSMPAEVSSPQSTEVDESLSMSLEQGPTTMSQRDGDDSVHHSNSNGGHFLGMSLPMRKPPRAFGQGSEMGRPPAPNTLHFETSAHDVDLCLVSPCEFKHFKPGDSCSGASESPRGAFAQHHHGNNNNPKDASPSESNAPVCTEDCPSTTADGALDSDEDESCSAPSNSPHDLHTSQALPQDPPPAPLRDSPPLPPHPDASMPVPQSDSDDPGKRTKANGMRGKKSAGVSLYYEFNRKGHLQNIEPHVNLCHQATQRSGSGKSRTGNQSGIVKVNVSSTRTTSSTTRSAPAKSSSNPGM